jgi:hypothetical protein
MPAGRLLVRVMLAITLVATSFSGSSAQVAQKKDAPPEPAVRGTLVRKSGTLLFIQPDGELQPRRFDVKPSRTILEPKFAAFIKDLAIGALVEFSYGRDSAGRRSANVLVLAAPGSFGVVTGVVIDKSDKVDAIEIQDAELKNERFCPHWRIGGEYKPPGGFDKEMLKAIVDVSIGDRVEVHWTKDDHLRVSTMRLVELSPRGLKKYGDEAGTVTGKLIEKGKDWVVIQTDDGDKQRYLPQKIIGGLGQLDYDVLRSIAELKIGDAVEARWFREGERRVYSLKAVAAK